ncbi:Uncharacterised protein [Mycobacteroides abscessus subsp. abscessus]|nr:Uncharacterised protein [Mycobacteroides abscessus subsp. abscessus]
MLTVPSAAATHARAIASCGSYTALCLPPRLLASAIDSAASPARPSAA